MAKCAVCGKGPQFGNNRSHSMRATRKMWKPNVSRRKLVINGEKQRVNVCTRCLRSGKVTKPPKRTAVSAA